MDVDLTELWQQVGRTIEKIDQVEDEEERMELRVELARLEQKLSRLLSAVVMNA